MEQVKKDLKRAEEELNSDSFTVINKYENGLIDCSQEYRKYKKCPMMQIIPVVAADSKVYVCHDKAYAINGLLGDLNKKRFKDIWYSKETKKIFDTYDLKENCKYHCAYDQRNIILDEYLNLSDDNINFI